MMNAIGSAQTPAVRPAMRGGAAGAAATSVDPARVLDTTKIGFRVAIEVVDVDANKLNRSISKSGWNATMTSDCSHGYKDSHNSYVMLQSPVMHAGEAAWKVIHEVLDEARGAGARLGNSGAMRVMIENKSLDLETYKSLMRMNMACEPIIYKAARNGKAQHVGESGWNSPAAPVRAQGGYYFCTPPSANPVSEKSLTATSTQQMQQILAGGGSYVSRHYGFQPFSVTQSGFSEFRYFTGTTDPDIVQADVEMVLGMVKCAHEGRWPAEVAPHAITDAKPVDYRTHQLFMHEVLGGRETANRIDTLFRNAGGLVTQPPLDTPEMRQYKSRLEQAGWRFNLPELSKVTAKTPIAVFEPGQREPYTVSGDAMPGFLKTENGQGVAPHAYLTGRLRELGAAFYRGDEEKPLTSRGGPATVMAQGMLQVAFDGKRVPLADEAALSRFAIDAMSNAYKPQLSADQQQAVDDVQKLFDQKRIVVTTTVPGHTGTTTLTSAQNLPWLLSEGAALQVAGDNGVVGAAIKDWPNLQRFGASEVRPSGAMANIQKLRDWGVEFHYVDLGGAKKRAGLNNEVDERLRARPMKAALPSWTWWNGLPRRTATLETPADLERLYKKFEAKKG